VGEVCAAFSATYNISYDFFLLPVKENFIHTGCITQNTALWLFVPDTDVAPANLHTTLNQKIPITSKDDDNLTQFPLPGNLQSAVILNYTPRRAVRYNGELEIYKVWRQS
jgi:hypothetical protein